MIEIFILSILFTSVQTYAFIRLGVFKFRHLKTYEAYLLFVHTLLLVFLLKFTHISPLGYGLSAFTIGFNSVANLYPRCLLGQLSTYIENYLVTLQSFKAFLPKDLLLVRFEKEFGYSEYIVEPALFQHVGLQSSMSQLLSPVRVETVQSRPFQSYSFIKEYWRPIAFDADYWFN